MFIASQISWRFCSVLSGRVTLIIFAATAISACNAADEPLPIKPSPLEGIDYPIAVPAHGFDGWKYPPPGLSVKKAGLCNKNSSISFKKCLNENFPKGTDVRELGFYLLNESFHVAASSDPKIVAYQWNAPNSLVNYKVRVRVIKTSDGFIEDIQ